MAGKVYLVGAGPGDPELLTLKGLRVLQEADVIIYDRLANPRLLAHAREDAERIYAGKGTGHQAMDQEAINRLLVARGQAGKRVCRLKGGDPFVFGRGGEEAEALTRAGIEWEYVPGITSAIAAPGYAGIPVTHRGLGSTFAIVTAHEDPDKGPASVRWEHLARGVDTVVFLMGAERLPRVVEQMLAHGRAPETPAAVVSWGTYPRQATVEGTLGTIVERCREAAGELTALAPAATIVGDVADLRARLRWFDNRPLFGKRIAVTRPREQSEGLARLLEERGAEVVRCPTIRIRPLRHPDLTPLSQFCNWLVFTSANGVYSLLTALKEAGRDIRSLGPARIAAIGPETARAAESTGLRVDFIPTEYVAEQVIEQFPEPVTGRRIVIVRAREARELLPDLWRRQGADVAVIPVYETVPDEAGIAALRDRLTTGEIDAITFTASSTVLNSLSLLPGISLEQVRVACIGPITAETARQAGLRVDIVAETYTAVGLVAALEQYYAAAEK